MGRFTYTPAIGQAITLRQGTDLTLIATGLRAAYCLEAADSLLAEGIRAQVPEVHTIKPLDEAAVQTAARETGAIATAEEHSIVGGLSLAVMETIESACPVPVLRVGGGGSVCRDLPLL